MEPELPMITPIFVMLLRSHRFLLRCGDWRLSSLEVPHQTSEALPSEGADKPPSDA